MTSSDNFLLPDRTAVQLYDAVKALPVIDWHNHLPVKDLADDRKYSDLTELWVAADPYKHRAMRICGIPEKLITGGGSPFEKFRAANEKLAGPEFSARGLLKKFNVEYAAPCASLSDDLSAFSGMEGIVPSLRGDDLFTLTSPLFEQAETLSNFCDLLESRLSEFHAAGCRFADHALDNGFTYVPDDGQNERRFIQFKQKNLPESERNALACEILRTLGGFYAELGWTLQLHIGALRRTSSRLRAAAGPAGGYAAIGKSCDIRALVSLLDGLEKSESGLPRVILYTLNPADHAMFAVLAGSFPGDGERGKVTLGPAWWYCDHIHGMRDCLENIAAYGVLSVFPGMTTDSRSLLSFVRHEYFRRVFCAWLAEKAARDELPDDFAILKELAEKICYQNAKAIISI